jgi:hypothetical protein
MKIGDLVSLKCKAFTGFGYIKGFGKYGDSYVLVGFISGKRYTKADQGYFPRHLLTLLKGE